MGDFDKKNRQLVYDQTTRRVHFKLYKAGKVWLAAGLATFTFGVTQMVGTTTLHAATVSETQTTVDNGLQQSSVTLSESAATASSAADSAADSSASTVVSTDSASAADESLNESSAASVASQSESNASSATNESTADVAASAVASGDVSSSASGQNTDSSASNVTASNSTSAYGSPQTKSLVKAAVAATTPATSSATDPLPAGFSVGEPTYPDGVFHYDEDSDWYTFAQIGTGSGTITFAIDRATQSNIQVGTVSVTDGVASISAVQNLAAGKSTYDGAMIFNEDQAIDVVASITYIFDVYAYKDGNDQPWGGYAFLKPILQTQTTEYIDQDGNQIADPVVMTGLSGQSYTTSPSTQITGYNPTASDNSTGFMSPFTSNGQTFVEVLYNIDGSKKGTLTYTVDDYKTGSMDYDFEPATPSYSAKKGTLKYGEDPEAVTVQTSGGNYTVKNPYVPQTTTITYTYNASDVNVTVKYVDENGNAIAADGIATGKFKQAITIDQPNITGYTYDQNYAVSDIDNASQYTVTDYTGENVVTLHYTTDDENVVILHMDSDGNLLNDATIGTGKYNQTFTADATNDKSFDIPGYRLDPTSNLAVKIGAGPNLINLKYDKLYTATINYVDQNGQQIDSSLLNNATTTLSGIVGENLAITSPKIAGYTAYADNPSSYTVVANETTITLRYVKTTMTVSVNVTPTADGTKVTATVVDGDGNSVNAGQPIDPNDLTGPKWPSNLTTDEIGSATSVSKAKNDLDAAVNETVHAYTVGSDGETLTSTSVSHFEVYFKRTATVDFSDLSSPKVVFDSWTPIIGAGTQNMISSYGSDVIGSDLIPALDYEMAYASNPGTEQTVVGYDSTGTQIELKNMTFQGISFLGIPPIQVTANSADLVYYIAYFNTDQLTKKFTRTVHYQTVQGTQLKNDTQQTASYTVKSSLDVSTPASPKLVNTIVWENGINAFAAVDAPEIQGYTSTKGVLSKTIEQTDATASEATIVYTPNTVTADVTIPSNLGNQVVTNTTGVVGNTVNISVPMIEGYTPNKTTVPATVNPDGTITTTETVTYTGNSIDYYIVPVDSGGSPLYGTNPIAENGTVGTKITVPVIPGYTAVATNEVVPADGGNVEIVYVPVKDYGTVGENENSEVATPVNVKEKVQVPTEGVPSIDLATSTVTIIPVDLSGKQLYGQDPYVILGAVAGYDVPVPVIKGYTPKDGITSIVAVNGDNYVTYVPVKDYGTVGENENSEVATPVNVKEKVQVPTEGVPSIDLATSTVTVIPVDLSGKQLYGQDPYVILGAVAGYDVSVPVIKGYTPKDGITSIVAVNGDNYVTYVPVKDYGTVGENENSEVATPVNVKEKVQVPTEGVPSIDLATSTVTIIPVDLSGKQLYGQNPYVILGAVAGYDVPVPVIKGYTPKDGITSIVAANGDNYVTYVPVKDYGTVGENENSEVATPVNVKEKVQVPTEGVPSIDLATSTVTIIPVDLSGKQLYGQNPYVILGAVAGYDVPVPVIKGYTPKDGITSIVAVNGDNYVTYVPVKDYGTVGENENSEVATPVNVKEKVQVPTEGVPSIDLATSTVTIIPVDLSGKQLYGQNPYVILGAVAGYDVPVPVIKGYTPKDGITSIVAVNGDNYVTYVPVKDYGTVGENENSEVATPVNVKEKAQQPDGVNTDGQTITITPVDLSGNPLYGQTPITIPGVAGYEVTVPEIPGYTAVTDTTVPTNGENKVVYVPKTDYGTVGENENSEVATLVNVKEKAQQPDGVNTDGQTVTITPVDLSGNPLYGQTSITIPGVAGYEVTVPEIPGYTAVTDTTVPTNGENKVVYVPKTDYGTVGENNATDDGAIISDPSHVYQKVQQPAGVNTDGQTVTITPVDLSGNPLYGRTPITIPGVAGYEVTVPEIPGYTAVTNTTVPTNGVNKVVYVPNVTNGTVGENEANDDGAIVSDPSHVYQKAQQPGGVNTDGQTVTITPVDLSGNPLYGQTPITIPGVAGYEVTVPEIPGYTPVTDTTVPTNGENKVVYVPKTDYGAVGENNTADDGAIVSDPSHVYQKAQQPAGVNTDGQTVTITPVDLSGNPLYGQTPITIPGVAGYEVTVPEIPGYTAITDTTVPTNGVNKVVYVPNVNNGTVGENETNDDGAIVSDPSHVYQKVQQPDGVNANGQTVTITPVDLSGNPLYGQTPITIPGVAGYEMTVPEIPGYAPVTGTTVPTNGVNKVVYVPNANNGTVGENDTPDDGAIVSDPNHVYQKVQQPAGTNANGQTVTITPVDLSGNPLYGQTPITIPGVAGYEVTVPEIPGYTPVTDTTVPTNGENKVVYVPKTDYGTVGENNTTDDGAIVSDPSHVYQKAQQPGGVNTDGQTVTITPVDLSGNPLYGQTPITIPGVAGYEVTVPEIPGYTAVTVTTVPTNGENKVVYVPKIDYGTVGENNTADDGAIVSDPNHVYQKVQQPDGVNTDGQTVTITPVGLSGNPLYGQTPITIPGVAGYEVTVPEIPGYTAVTDTTVPTNGENKVVYVPKTDYGTVGENNATDDGAIVSDPSHVYQKVQQPAGVNTDGQTVTITPVDLSGNPLYGQTPITIPGVAGYEVTVPEIPGYTAVTATTVPINGENKVVYVPKTDYGTVGENNTADDGAIVSDPNHVYQKVQQPAGVNADGQTVTITPVDLSGNPLYGQTPITIPGVAGYEATVPEIPGYTPVTGTTVPTNGINKVVYVPNVNNGIVGENETNGDGAIVSDPNHVYQKAQQPAGVNANGQTVTITPVDLSGNPLYGQTPITIPGVAGYEVTVPEIPGYTAVTATTVPTNGENKVVYVPVNGGSVDQNGTPETSEPVTDPDHVYEKDQVPGTDVPFVDLATATVTITPVDVNGNPLYGQSPIKVQGVAGYPVTVPDIAGYTPTETTIIATNGANVVTYIPNKNAGIVPNDSGEVATNVRVYERNQIPDTDVPHTSVTAITEKQAQNSISTTETVLDESNQSGTPSASQSNRDHSSVSAARLPQTDNASNYLGKLGVIMLSVVSLITALGARRKKDSKMHDHD